MKTLTKNQIVPSAGATDTIDVSNPSIPAVINLIPEVATPQSLAGNYSLAYSSTSEFSQKILVSWNGGDFDLSGQSMTIFGVSVSQEMLDTSGLITVLTIDDLGTLVTSYSANLSVVEALNGNVIKTDTLPLDRLTGMTAAQVILADSGNTPTATTISGDISLDNAGVVTIANEAVTNAKMADLNSAYFKVGDGSNRPADVQMSGDATMDNTGAVTISDGVITPQKLSFTTGVIAVAQVTLSSAEILALNSTPIKIIDAPGVGSSIVVISALFTYTYATSAYSTNVTLQVYTDTATSPQAAAAILDADTSKQVRLSLSTGSIGVSDTMVIENKALYVTVPAGNPTGGLGTGVLTVWYVTI